MATSQGKKKSLMGRLIKWFGISFIVILAVLIALPFMFKDKIKEMVLEEINNTLTAKVDYDEIDLTLLSTFPDMSIVLTGTEVIGTGEFEGLTLAKIEEFRANVKFWSVVSGEQIEIDEIHLEKPEINVKVTKEGLANYDIVKSDDTEEVEEEEVSEDSNFKLSLKKYSIVDANISYDDQEGDMLAILNGLTHTGKGDLTAETVDFRTDTEIDALSYEMEGMSYMSKVNTKAIANLLIEMTDETMKFTFEENEFHLNNLSFGLDGYYAMNEDHDMMDLKLNASQASFKDLLSLIPTFYHSGYESMIASGSLGMNGMVKGRMDDVNMPGWDFKLNIANAGISYPDLSEKIDNINVNAGSKFSGGTDMDKMTLDIDKFHAEFAGNTIDANLALRNPMTDPQIKSKIMADVDLESLAKVMPMAEGESYQGKLLADIVLDGAMSSLEEERYEDFNADGTLTLSGMKYKTNDLPKEVLIENMVFAFSPKALSLKELKAKMGNSDFAMKGSIDNYMGYALRDELLHGDFIFNSNNLDLDELMGMVPEDENQASTSGESPSTAEESTTEETTDEEPIVIPGNIDFLLHSTIGNLKYNDLNIKDIDGDIRLKDQVASLNDVRMSAMGGTIGLNGSFDTKDETKPLLNFGYDLKDIDIQELVSHFATIETIAPIAKAAQGKISSKFNMNTALQANLEPIYNTLDGKGDFFSQAIKISGYKPMDKLANALNKEELATKTINKVKAAFKFEDGKVTVSPFDVKLGNINTNISGYTSFDQNIDYKLKMDVPKSEIPGELLKVVEDQIKKVNKLAPNLDFAGLPDIIPVKASITGTPTDPKVKTDFKEAILEATGNLKDNMKDAAKEVIEKAKDSVQEVIEEKVEDVKEDIAKEIAEKKKAILDAAQKQANQVKAQGKKAADAVRSEGEKQAQEVIKQAGNNPIKKKAAELTANKIRKEANQKADKIENEANAKADNIMADAKTKADAIK